MKVAQFLLLGTIAALLVACGAWALVWFSGVPTAQIQKPAPLISGPAVGPSAPEETDFTGRKNVPERAPTRSRPLAKGDDRKRQEWDRELDKKTNSICRGC